ncbi:MAG: hypothetical protein A2Y10_17305 [Planctomycetes bacterium GWF2_41_51]|nr:MAG: hypothetical protein A2Y10_17305 [Planctomycetes bacterium GWF2_41_51]
MCKKLVSIICVLALTSMGFAEVIGNFGESGNGLDGWTDESGSESVLSISTTGATIGSGALRVQVQGPAWYNHIGDKVLSADQMGKIMDGTYTAFTVDVTRFAAEGWTTSDAGWGWWTPESRLFFSLSATAYNEYGQEGSYGGGQEKFGAEWYPSTLNYRSLENPDLLIAPGMLPDGVDPDPDGTLTASWDLAAEVAGIQAALINAGFIYADPDGNALGLAGMDIRLIANVTCWNGPGMSTYYLDNAQLIPEPATMTLLALGLALLRRKH